MMTHELLLMETSFWQTSFSILQYTYFLKAKIKAGKSKSIKSRKYSSMHGLSA